MADKHNDGIEERAAKHLRDNDLVWSVEGSLPRIVADFTVAETATLTARVKELEEALGNLVDVVDSLDVEYLSVDEVLRLNTPFEQAKELLDR